ncbi:MAG: tRNA pseudouridine(38-40) synthase TruA [Anaerolineaceae bacterium]|nr:tRNA pseudouridine(38-40) synthase TruA [Anaerolineaceae bacterium]
MERYQVILAYDGTDFRGFQRQGNGARTVQAVFESTLRAIGWQGSSILAAGRTDSGVHASGQVIAFDLDWNHSTEILARALNAKLDDDLSVRHVQLAAPDFHPRFSAKRRSYSYRIFADPHQDPLRERFAWRLDSTPNEALLHEAAALLPGMYDCAAFGSVTYDGGTTVRKIYQAEWLRTASDELSFQITGNAFLYHMVRRIVFLLVRVGQERLSLQALKAGIAQEVELPPGLAPARGLVLTDVDYVSPR